MTRQGHNFSEIPHETWVVFVVRTVNSIGFSATIPFLAVYLFKVRYVPLSEIGLVYLASGIIGLASQMIGGRLTDSIGPKKVMLTAYLSSLLFSIMLGYLVLIQANVAMFFFIYPAFSLFRGISQPATSSIIAEQRASNVRTGFSLLSIGGNLGFAIGPALGGIFATIYSYSSVFAISATSSMAVLLISSIWITGGIRNSSEGSVSGKTRLMLSWEHDRNIILFLCLTFCLFLAVGYEIVPLSLYSSDFLHLSDNLIGYLFATNGLTIVILQLPLTKLIEKSKMLVRPLVISSLFTTASFLIASVSTNFVDLEVMMFVITLGEIFLSVPAQTIIALFSRSGNRGTYQGYYSAASSAGRSVASFVGPLSFSLFAYDPPLSWYAIATFALLAGLGFAILSPALQKDYENTLSRIARKA